MYGLPRNTGIALVIVLWVLTLLTIMALGLTATQRSENALTSNQIDQARFRALADGALAVAALNLSATPQIEVEPGEVWVPDGQLHEWWFNGQSVEIRVFNEASRINLNRSDQGMLRSLMVALGIEEEEAESLAAAILDWRDEDDAFLINGAEDGDYEAAGMPYGAGDTEFRSVGELRQVLGVSNEIFALLAPELTVATTSDAVDDEFASAAVVAALNGITVEEAEADAQLRDEQFLEEGEPLIPVNRGGPLYRIRVTQRQGDVSSRSMEALVRVIKGNIPPMQVVWKRYGLIEPEEPAGEMDLGGEQ